MKALYSFLISVSLSLGMYAQSGVPFNGMVFDAHGAPLKNIHIYVQNPRKYSRTDKLGRFGLTDVKATDTLKVVVKKHTYYIPVANKKSIKIYLADERQVRTEEDKSLVDFGYGFVKRRENTGVSNGISGDELRRSGYTDILSALQGRIPGLNVGANGGAGVEPSVSMRGTNSFMLSQTPLFVVDGVIVDTLMGISLMDVDHVEVLKDASIYGSRGANGAILVTTKHGPSNDNGK